MQSIERIHNSNFQFVLAISGGGSEAISQLLKVPGASATVIEAIVPYSSKSMEYFLGGPPEQACSERNARAMAMAAYMRAIAAGPGSSHRAVAGISCTAALATDRVRKGLHQIHIAIQTDQLTRSLSITLQKGIRTREEEELIASNMIIRAICELCEVPFDGDIDLSAGEKVLREVAFADAPTRDLFSGNIKSLRIGKNSSTETPLTIFPGAFNPLHNGHRKIASLATRLTGQTTHLELSIINVDKLPLDYMELDHRVRRISAERPLILTRAPTFIEKSALFPGATFVIGIDTLMRIADSRYYNNDNRATRAALRTIRKHNCRFLVFGREIKGKFCTLDDVILPELMADICSPVPEQAFHMNISSTEERARELKQAQKNALKH